VQKILGSEYSPPPTSTLPEAEQGEKNKNNRPMATKKRSYEKSPICDGDIVVRNAKVKRYFKVDTDRPSYSVCTLFEVFWLECEPLRVKYANSENVVRFCMKQGAFTNSASGLLSTTTREEMTTVYKLGDKWVASHDDARTLKMQSLLNYDPHTRKFDLSEFFPTEPMDPDDLLEFNTLFEEIGRLAHPRDERECHPTRVVSTVPKPAWIDACLAAKAEAEA
jgi:hypothetical protein